MPNPSPVTYPSPSLNPGFAAGVQDGMQIAIGTDLVLGSKDAAGAEWTIDKFDGWGSTGSTSEFQQLAGSHGSTASDGYMKSRFMTAGGLVYANGFAALEDAADRLADAVSLDDTQFIVSAAGRVRHTYARRQGEVIVDPITDKMARYSILMAAKDPLKYGDPISVTTHLPSSSGGATWPVTFPLTFTGSSVSGVVSINNTGTEQAPVWLRIDGPLPAGGWAVMHMGKKQQLSFASSLALGGDEFVTVDMTKHEVLAQGQAPRAGFVTSRGWFSLDPGPNDIAFTASNYSAAALLTVTTKPTWR